MIKFEVDSKRVGGTDARWEYQELVKNYSHRGSVEQLMGELGVITSRVFGGAVGNFLAENGVEDLDTFCALIDRVGKTMLLSALVNAAMHWAEEHDTPVEMEALAARFAQGLGGKVQDEPRAVSQ